MKRFTAAIIGIGQIGQEFDYECNDGSLILTHANAFLQHPGFEIVGAVDSNEEKRRRFEDKFKKPSFPNSEALFNVVRPEVIAIAVPTPIRLSIFQEIISCQPAAVICEKPIAANSDEAKTIIEMGEDSGCAILVNYIRRFDPGVIALKKLIEAGEFGEIYKGTAWYSKGLLNSGSHFLDLLLFLLGRYKKAEIINKGRLWQAADPEPDVKITLGDAEVFFLSGKEEFYSIGEIELTGTKGRIAYSEFGYDISYRKTTQDPTFSGYTILAKERIPIANDLNRYQWHVLEHLYKHLTENLPLNSTGQTALETLGIIESIVHCGGYHV